MRATNHVLAQCDLESTRKRGHSLTEDFTPLRKSEKSVAGYKNTSYQQPTNDQSLEANPLFKNKNKKGFCTQLTCPERVGMPRVNFDCRTHTLLTHTDTISCPSLLLVLQRSLKTTVNR